MRLTKFRTAIVLTVVLILAIGLYDLVADPSPDNNYALSPEETPLISAEHSSTNETLTLTITKGEFTRASDILFFRNPRSSEKFLIANSNSETRTNVWASRSLFRLGIGNPGIADFPLTPGEKVVIKKDFTDIDSDGRKGIEENETVILYSKDGSTSTEVLRFKIESSSVTLMFGPIPIHKLDLKYY